MTHCYPKRATNLASRVLKGEAIIMNPTDSSLFSLNPTATVIWLAADGVTPLETIVERDICPQFDIDLETARRDAFELVNALEAQAILVTATEPHHD